MTDTEPEDATTPVDSDELIKQLQQKRTVAGRLGIFVALVGLSFSVFQLLLAAKSFYWDLPLPVVGEIRLVGLQLLQANAIHVVFALVLTFLLYPPTTGDGRFVRAGGRIYSAVLARVGPDSTVGEFIAAVRGGVRWAAFDPDQDRLTPLDVALAAVAALAAIYFLAEFQEIQNLRVRGLVAGQPFYEAFPFAPVFEAIPFLEGLVTAVPGAEFSYAFFLGIVGVFLVLEATRRTIGLPLMLIVASFIVYARWGHLIPGGTPYVGILSIPELSWQAIVQNLWYNTENGVFGIPVTVSVQFIYIFILFGAFLEKSGAGQWFIDLAYAGTGTRTGGPAKASILASGFMGTISGSSIANTVTTGTFTIPLMKRSGYDAEFSGAVESAASSGGQILPPVMGAAAFLIVQYTATPFADVIVAATIPAIVFFFGVWVMVHLKAVQTGVGGLDKSELVNVGDHLRRGWFYLVPLALLLYYLIVERLSVGRSAWYTILAIAALVALVAAYNDSTATPGRVRRRHARSVRALRDPGSRFPRPVHHWTARTARAGRGRQPRRRGSGLVCDHRGRAGDGCPAGDAGSVALPRPLGERGNKDSRLGLQAAVAAGQPAGSVSHLRRPRDGRGRAHGRSGRHRRRRGGDHPGNHQRLRAGAEPGLAHHRTRRGLARAHAPDDRRRLDHPGHGHAHHGDVHHPRLASGPRAG